MFKDRSTIRRVALVAVAALAVLWLVPPEHLHPALAGRPVIHRHTIAVRVQPAVSSVDHDHHGDHHDHGTHGDHDDGRDHGSPGDHGDHRDAQILKTVFASAPKFAPESPAVTQMTVVIASSWCVVGYLAVRYDWTCHDPPERPTSLRAPPTSLSLLGSTQQ